MDKQKFLNIAEKLKASGEEALKRHAAHGQPIVYFDFKSNKTVKEFISGRIEIVPEKKKVNA
ncbi:MAG: hypothetical protein K2X86_15480 [Cytophagaceae bacterium]|nr:hypothetical protein [Cytophagaceae bacterium]